MERQYERSKLEKNCTIIRLLTIALWFNPAEYVCGRDVRDA